MEHKTVSIADQIFEQLEREILCGEYEKGEILTEIKLSEKLGVSRTPIREALRRLASEHIIYETPRGALVLGISPEDMADIYEIRYRLEGLAARKAALNASSEDIAELKKILDLQEFYTQKQDADSIKNYDTDFHEQLYRCSGSPNLFYTLSPLHRKGIKYRKASLTKSTGAVHAFEEHKAIYDAIVTHNPVAAENAAVIHIINARERLFGKD